MKRIIFSLLTALTLSLGMVGVASAHAKPVTHTTYMLSPAYTAVYCYPTGSYWVSQLSNPNNAAYYAANNAYYEHAYGAGTEFC